LWESKKGLSLYGTTKANKMKLRNKVEARLLKGGFNPTTVVTMMDEHFAYASSKYTGVAKIADVVSTLY